MNMNLYKVGFEYDSMEVMIPYKALTEEEAFELALINFRESIEAGGVLNFDGDKVTNISIFPIGINV